jgi:hypothetical protein
MQPCRRPFSRICTALALTLASLAAAPQALAANHALILWIGDYGGAHDLPGINHDAAMARRIALAMGVPDGNIRDVGNAQLTKVALARALTDLHGRIAQDAKVFIYYSGHGHQRSGLDGARCTEGMVTRDPDLFEDFRLESALTALGRKASQLVVMNDSCFSGDAATKDLQRGDGGGARDEFVPKFYRGSLPAGAAVAGDHECGGAVNRMSRNLRAVGSDERAPQVLYIAASAADEVSLATPQGSLATRAWAQCLQTADIDRSGAVDGDELRACAQGHLDRWLQRRGGRQTLTMAGNTRLPLTFTDGGGAATGTTVDPARTLADIQAMRDPSHRVSLQAARSTLRIGRDALDFNVTTDREGYLYVLHVGSDGKTFDLLFPNGYDRDHRVSAGTHRLPRPQWQVTVAGPAGTSRLMAMVSPRPLDFSKGMNLSTAFASTAANAGAARNLMSESTTRFGASEVVDIHETD